MKYKLPTLHRKKLEEIRKEFSTTSLEEGNFIKVELMFYEAIGVARECNSNEQENTLLAALKDIQFNQYRQTQTLFKKNIRRERVIRRFVSSVIIVLAEAIKNGVTAEKLVS